MNLHKGLSNYLTFFQPLLISFLKIKLSISPAYHFLVYSKLNKVAINGHMWYLFINFIKLQNLNSVVNKHFTESVRHPQHLHSLSKSYYSRFFYTGLGYKIFKRKNTLFIWMGLTHFLLLPIPKEISVFTKKRRIYFITYRWQSQVLINFLMKLKKVKKIDIYKGKGLAEVKSYKGFIKMKSTKKKQR